MKRRKDDSGIALITSILMLALMSALLVGAVTLAVSEQKSRFQDKDRTVAFEAAHGGLEKLTNDLGDLFNRNYSPTTPQIETLRDAMPSLGGAVFSLKGSSDTKSGYKIVKGTETSGKITEGAYEGLTANITPYTVQVTARTPTESEVSLERTVNTVAIPVFQFGIFSETDLSYFPGPQFNFGGRVHTNGNLFLAKGNGSQLILGDRVTAFKEIVRKYLANGHAISDNYTGEVRVLTEAGGCATAAQISKTSAPYTCRPLLDTEGSVTGNLDPVTHTGTHNTNWDGGASPYPISTGIYNSNILTHPEAKKLNLPLAAGTAKPIDLIRRPAVGENSGTGAALYSQRYYQYASIRILLSDNAADITALPDSGTPIQLNTRTELNSTVQQGWISIMMQGAPAAGATNGAWTDVTAEILNKGLSGRNPVVGCDTYVPDLPASITGSIIRLQRIANTSTGTKAKCTTGPTAFWPNTLYDTREGRIRDYRDDDAPLIAGGGGKKQFISQVHRGGVMYYVELDVKNLRAWFKTKGTGIMQETGGYVVYFSDRRGNHDWFHSDKETGELGYEDVINPPSHYGDDSGGTAPQDGEDINENSALDTYGGRASAIGGITYWDKLDTTTAQSSSATLFRRALKLVHGNRLDMVGSSEDFLKGLTIAAENPIYIQGDYNAIMSEDTTAGDEWLTTYDKPHIASAVIADAVTLLSNDWRDNVSFDDAHNLIRSDDAGATNSDPKMLASNRWPSSNSGAVYRTAIISGKSLTFPKPEWAKTDDTATASRIWNEKTNDFGTDGGTHNFLRYLERWSRKDNGNGIPLWYRGSMVSFYTSRQAVGSFKCCTVVYGAPERHYTFDEDFKDTSKLPPRTPVVRDVNTTSFTKKSGPPTS